MLIIREEKYKYNIGANCSDLLGKQKFEIHIRLLFKLKLPFVLSDNLDANYFPNVNIKFYFHKHSEQLVLMAIMKYQRSLTLYLI